MNGSGNLKTTENSAIQHEFSQTLDANSEGPIITETFGWAPAAVAAELVFFLIYASTQPGSLKFTHDTSEFAAGAAIAALPLLLFGYEFWRRRKRRTFVRFDKSNHIGIYRHGLLERIIFAENIGIYTRNHTNTFVLTLPGSVGVICSPIAFLRPGGSGALAFTTGDRFMAVATFLCSTALLVSVIRTRLFCKVLLLPRKGSRRFHSFLVRKQDAPRMLRQF